MWYRGMDRVEFDEPSPSVEFHQPHRDKMEQRKRREQASLAKAGQGQRRRSRLMSGKAEEDRWEVVRVEEEELRNAVFVYVLREDPIEGMSSAGVFRSLMDMHMPWWDPLLKKERKKREAE